MDPRISSPGVIPSSTASANAAAASIPSTPTANTRIATNDSVSFTVAATNGAATATPSAAVATPAAAGTPTSDLASIAQAIQELNDRLGALEAEVNSIQSRVAASGQGSPDASGAPAANAQQPAANAQQPAANAQQPAANADPTASNAAPTTNTAASANSAIPAIPSANATLPAANSATATATPAANDASTATPAANGTQPGSNAQGIPDAAATGTVPAANDAPTAPAAAEASASTPSVPDQPDATSQNAALQKDLLAMKAKIEDQVATINQALAQTSAVSGQGAAEAQLGALTKQQAGLHAVSDALAQAKLINLTPEEEQVVQPAVKRVHEIGLAIGQGANPDEFAAELYSLKYTLGDPAGVGNHPAVTQAAQLVGRMATQKLATSKRLDELKAKAARGPLTPAEVDEAKACQATLKRYAEVDKALDGAKLTRLSPEGLKRALAAIDRLGALAFPAPGATAATQPLEQEAFALGQTLKNPNGTDGSAQVAQGAEVLKQVSTAQADVASKLAALDQKLLGGQLAPESLMADREHLIEQGRALQQLSGLIKGAKLDQANPAAKREITQGLQRASQLAQAIASGNDPNQFWAEEFVLKQTFQDPIGSKNNPAVQSGAAALQVIGRAEAKNLKAQEDLEAKVKAGTDPRTLDAEQGALHRQEQDLAHMRHAIERADYTGLTEDQKGQGATLIDQMREIALKVGSGESYATHQKAFDALAQQLESLHHVPPAGTANVSPSGNGTPAAKPLPAAPKPTPAVAAKPLERGGVYQVQAGDYLTKIARERLGSAKRFTDIIALNKDRYPSLAKNPDLIQPGWTLVLPKA